MRSHVAYEIGRTRCIIYRRRRVAYIHTAARHATGVRTDTPDGRGLNRSLSVDCRLRLSIRARGSHERPCRRGVRILSVFSVHCARRLVISIRARKQQLMAAARVPTRGPRNERNTVLYTRIVHAVRSRRLPMTPCARGTRTSRLERTLHTNAANSRTGTRVHAFRRRRGGRKKKRKKLKKKKEMIDETITERARRVEYPTMIRRFLITQTKHRRARDDWNTKEFSSIETTRYRSRTATFGRNAYVRTPRTRRLVIRIPVRTE